MTARIRSVRAWEALDSRGRPTVGCVVETEEGARGRVVVPSGASTGAHEAVERRDGGARYDGWGVSAAVAAVHGELGDAVRGADVRDQATIDATLERVDGDAALGRTGANAVLAISLATAVAAADAERIPLWRRFVDDDPVLPMPMINIVSGGAHAARLIDIQDVLVIPRGATTFAQALEWAGRVRSAAGSLVTERGGSGALVADEGGVAAALAGNEAALGLVVDAIGRAGLRPGEDVVLALDLAATQFWRRDAYVLAAENRTSSTVEWAETLAAWCARYPLVSVEDPFAEDEWPAWTEFTSRVGSTVQIVGDDHFATNTTRVERGIARRSATAVLVKPNQAGTVTRARSVCALARAAGFGTIVSARSGDTEDHWLADLAVGWSAGQIKVGSTLRSERTAKWNRLLELEAAGIGRFASFRIPVPS